MPGQRSATPFVGRQRELDSLLAALAAARAGQGGVVLLAGEPGIGKTRLLAELAARAQAAGWLVLGGRAFEEDAPPYGLFAEPLRHYARECAPEDLLQWFGGDAAPVSLLLPELTGRLDAALSGSLAPASLSQYAIFAGASNALLRVARAQQHGLLLTLDDLHWADKPSVLLLLHLARHLEDAPLLITAGYRTVAAGTSASLADLLAELRRERLAERLLLPALSLDETRQLSAQVAGTRVAAPIVLAIQERTDGNPFFIEEVVQHLQNEGMDLGDPGGGGLDWRVPEGVREVISRRLTRLQPETVRVLQGAAVLGADGSLALLQAMYPGDQEQLVSGLDEAVAAGMLREQGDGYQFCHALIRDTMYAGLSLPRRQALHLSAAEAIERLPTALHDQQAGVLAAHYQLAGPAGVERAIACAVRAGEAAQRVFALEEAARYWQMALLLLEQQGAAPERLADLLERLSTLVYSMGFDHYADAIAYDERALHLYTAAGATEALPRVHVSLGLMYGSNSATLNIPRAEHHHKAARELIANLPESQLLGLIYHGFSNLAVWAARTEVGLEASRRVLDLGERLGDADLWWMGAAFLGWHLVSAGRLREGLALMEQGWEAADRMNQVTGGFIAANWRAERSSHLRDPQDACAWLEPEIGKPRQAYALARRNSMKRHLASQYACSGDLAVAERIVAETGDLVAEQSPYMMALPLLALWRGDWAAAEAELARVHADHVRTGNRKCEAEFGLWLARVAALQGDTARAEALLQQSLAIALDAPQLPFVLEASTGLALLYTESGRAPQAAPQVERCREILSAGEAWRGLAGQVVLAEAVVAAATHRLADAEAAFTRAIQISRRYTLVWDEAEALRYWGQALAAAGLTARAAEKLQAAVDIYRRHGAGQPSIERVTRDIPLVAGRQQRERQHPTYPGGLSEREVEVLRLVATGKTNREIAASLVVSESTVAFHVRSIFNKTGVANRTEAGAYAHQHNLVGTEP